MRLLTIGHLLLAVTALPLILCEVFQGCVKDPPNTRIHSPNSNNMKTYTDSCPRHFRRCNDSCLDRTTNHTSPCHSGPWGKCLSAHFPFYCNVTDTCIGKDEICGDHCFDGSPGSFWYDHTDYDEKGEYGRKVNLWKLEEGVYEEIIENRRIWALSHVHQCKDITGEPLWGSSGRWLQRYNCNGKCITYKEPCNGGCNHPDHIMKGGITMNLGIWKPQGYQLGLHKCGTSCLTSISGLHDCGDECLAQNIPCNGTCPDSTEYPVGPQWLCGNECRPMNQKNWKVCPDGSCRDNSVNCEGPLPESCPQGQLLCRYHSVIRGNDYNCGLSSNVFFCNETRENNGFGWGLKHPDIWCFRYSEPCNNQCYPGYTKCQDKSTGTTTCKISTEVIMCGDECLDAEDFHMCDGSCIETSEMCEGSCAPSHHKCGDRCVKTTWKMFESVECHGVCQRPDLLCDGECIKPGFSKLLQKDIQNDIEEVVCFPDYPNYLDGSPFYGKYHRCNGIAMGYDTPCNETCVTDPDEDRKLCRGVCVKERDTWDCNGECLSQDEHCNGKCYFKSKVPCGKKCADKGSLDAGVYKPCGDRCMRTSWPYDDFPCDGQCPEGKILCGGICFTEEKAAKRFDCEYEECKDRKVLCGKKCFTEKEMKNRHKCGDKCIALDYPCEGECPEERPFKCVLSERKGERCLDPQKVGDGNEDCQDGSDEICFQQWSCNGVMQCINKPCQSQDQSQNNNQTICQSLVNKTVCTDVRLGKKIVKDCKERQLGMYYCPSEHECKPDYVPCDGVCISTEYGRSLPPRSLFACQDGSKCISKRRVCNGVKGDCQDGSDEKCVCKGDINCSERLWSDENDIFEPTRFRCENGEESIRLSKYCDGKVDCSDESDEVCDACPGIYRCKDRNLVCGNIPCDNTGQQKRVLGRYVAMDEPTCERKGYDLCVTNPGEAKCVKRAIDGKEEGKRWTDKKAEDGEACNDHCFAGVKCGNKCLAKFENWYPACNGNCDHINSTKTIVNCDGYCWDQEQLIEDSKLPYQPFVYNNDWHTVTCDGECRMFANWDQRRKTSRRTCNGTCLHGGGSYQWISCDSGDQCYRKEEWCNGEAECEDGSDEANCDLCPSIRHCDTTPQVNHTKSNGPRFPDFVCPDEPCGKFCDDYSHHCGNACIPINQVCPLTNECRSNSDGSPPMFKCDKCLDAELVCDGKQDCQDGSDEDNCVGNVGSWVCNGQVQSKAKPCIK